MLSSDKKGVVVTDVRHLLVAKAENLLAVVKADHASSKLLHLSLLEIITLHEELDQVISECRLPSNVSLFVKSETIAGKGGLMQFRLWMKVRKEQLENQSITRELPEESSRPATVATAFRRLNVMERGLQV